METLAFIYSIISSIIDAIIWLISPLRGGKQFSASFARLSTITSPFNKGFSPAGGLRAIKLNDASYSNAIIVGQTGSGKSLILTSSIFTLARAKSSMVVVDAAGSIYNTTSGYLASQGYAIYRINTSQVVDTYNPIFDCATIADCEKLAELLILNGEVSSKSDPFWSTSAAQGLKIFITYIALYAPLEKRTMHDLVLLLNTYAAEPSEVDKLFIKTSEALLKEYKAFNAVSPNTRQSILVTMRMAVKVYATENVVKCTASTSIPFAIFRDVPSVLYITLDITGLSFFSSYVTIIYQRAFKEILSAIPTKNQLAIFCLIDELVLFKFKNLGTIFSNIRKFRGGIIALIQDTKMLAMSFSEAETHAIISNCYLRVYLSVDHKTSLELEREFGQTIIKDKKGNDKTVPLLAAAQIRQSKHIFVLANGHPPIKTKLVRYYKHFLFKQYAAIPPYIKPTSNNE